MRFTTGPDGCDIHLHAADEPGLRSLYRREHEIVDIHRILQGCHGSRKVGRLGWVGGPVELVGLARRAG